MMTNQEKLVEIMELKAEFASMPEFFTEEDRTDLLSWSDEKAKVVIQAMSDINFIKDGDTCPWCISNIDSIYLKSQCTHCEYGKRHGICDNFNSDYRSAIKNYKYFHLNRELMLKIKYIVKYQEQSYLEL